MDDNQFGLQEELDDNQEPLSNENILAELRALREDVLNWNCGHPIEDDD